MRHMTLTNTALEAFKSQKSMPPQLSMGPTPGLSAHYKKPIKCYYFFQMNHGFNRCSVLSLDETNGAFKRAGNNFFLPDNSQIPWDPSRSIKQVVDVFSRRYTWQNYPPPMDNSKKLKNHISASMKQTLEKEQDQERNMKNPTQ